MVPVVPVVPSVHSRTVKSLELFRSKPVIEHFLGQAVYNKSLVAVVHSATKEVPDATLNSQAVANVELAVIFSVKGPLIVVGLSNNEIPFVPLVLKQQAAETGVSAEVVWFWFIALQPLTESQLVFDVSIVINVEFF